MTEYDLSWKLKELTKPEHSILLNLDEKTAYHSSRTGRGHVQELRQEHHQWIRFEPGRATPDIRQFLDACEQSKYYADSLHGYWRQLSHERQEEKNLLGQQDLLDQLLEHYAALHLISAASITHLADETYTTIHETSTDAAHLLSGALNSTSHGQLTSEANTRYKEIRLGIDAAINAFRC